MLQLDYDHYKYLHQNFYIMILCKLCDTLYSNAELNNM